MDFGVLGPLLVRRGGVVLQVAPGKQRALLATLLLSSNRAVSVDELAEALWDSHPPPSSRATLQNYVKRLRSTLGDAGAARISTLPRGYLIRVEPGELDAARFESLLGLARAAWRDGAWEQAAAHLRDALSLWRGEPLADVRSEFLALREVPRLAEMRLQAVQARIEADLRVGRHAEVIAELRRLIGAQPLREPLYALLMLALYRGGQQAEALAVYQRARRVLVEELGADPGPELRRLEQRILAGDPALDPQAAVTARGAAEAAVPGPWRRHAPPRQLPAAVRHFAGRAGELADLTGVLDIPDTQLPETVVISAIGGTAGVGKTALAVHWAHQVAARFPDGQLYVNLRGFDPSGTPVPPDDAIRGFLDALQVPPDRVPPSPQAREGLYRSLLAGRRMLVVLDNARDAAQARPLLPGEPGCLVLVTSRSPLTSLVAAVGAHPVRLDVLSAAEGRALLALRLGQERITAEPDVVAELTALCAGLPLALAIVAARAAMRPGQPLATLAAEFRDAAGVLDVLDGGDAATSVRATLSWSYRQLPAPAARMFRLLSVHPGPDITAAAAASLAGTSPAMGRRLLDELIRANLLAGNDQGRFAFHDLLRAYAGERASAEDSEPERRAAIHRMLDYYLHSARAADLALFPHGDPVPVAAPQPGVRPDDLAGAEQAMAWFGAEYRVLLAVAAQAAARGFDAHGWQLPVVLRTFADRRGYWHDYLAALDTAHASARRLGDRAGQALVQRQLGHVSTMLGRYPDARAHQRQALRLYRQLRDARGQGHSLIGLAGAAERQGRYRQALAHCLNALGMYQAAGDRHGQAGTLNNIGWCHAQLREYAQALTFCEQAAAIHQELGDRHGAATAWDSLGYAHHQLGLHPEAVACYRQAIDLFREQGDRFNQADVLIHLGDDHLAAGQPQTAAAAWAEALAILGDLHHPRAAGIRVRLRAAPPNLT
jgi:DNA-binding SARP family transcriptional activator/Tfp pilus assembly protein PilF